jgi:hypothetical protein
VEIAVRLVATLTLFAPILFSAPVGILAATHPVFEPNAGQVDESGEWVVRRGASTPMFLRATGAAIARDSAGAIHFVEMRFDGASAQAESGGEEPLESYSNYYLGRDDRSWFTRIAHFARVRYRDVYFDRGSDLRGCIARSVEELAKSMISAPGKQRYPGDSHLTGGDRAGIGRVKLRVASSSSAPGSAYSTSSSSSWEHSDFKAGCATKRSFGLSTNQIGFRRSSNGSRARLRYFCALLRRRYSSSAVKLIRRDLQGLFLARLNQ